MQEAALVLGMVLQRFKLIDHTRYKLKIKEALTIKPEGFKIKVRPRTDRAPMAKSSAPVVVSTQPNGAAPDTDQGVKGDGRVLTVLYGTSLGTCRDIAGQIADRAGSSGFQVTNAALDGPGAPQMDDRAPLGNTAKVRNWRPPRPTKESRCTIQAGLIGHGVPIGAAHIRHGGPDREPR